ncbi:hypothetical protein UFOVP411_46 [uncultured Caudovirales phage]|uniref:Uncharacterized protein n=1 Tax=uncultured Caudovirales phage TaxID=2100421 RepID=A0A6J5M4D8_9CAUD|nr:hypothetical protein UFOVP411_46 [uncultured Caudovirales phage]
MDYVTDMPSTPFGLHMRLQTLEGQVEDLREMVAGTVKALPEKDKRIQMLQWHLSAVEQRAEKLGLLEKQAREEAEALRKTLAERDDTLGRLREWLDYPEAQAVAPWVEEWAKGYTTARRRARDVLEGATYPQVWPADNT